MQPSLKLPFTYETLLDAVVESIICIDLEGRILYWSKGAERIYEYSAAEAVGQPYAMLFPGGVEEGTEALRGQGHAMPDGQRSVFQGWRVTKSGRRIYVRVAGSSLFDDAGKHVGFVGHAIDITAQKQAEMELQASRSRMETLLEAQSRADIGLFVIEEGRVVYANDALCRLFGYTLDEVKALPSYLELTHPVDRERVAQNHQRRLQGEQFPKRYDIAIITKAGERREVEITASPIEAGGRPGVLVVTVDITDRKRSEERVQYLALHDALTGLANRVLFFDRLNTAIAAAHRKNGSFALLYLDLDDFKPINDNYGHGTGDLVLRSIAERLRSCVRESDTVARLGGDEFILLFNDTQDETAAVTVAEKVIATATEPLPVAGGARQVGCSIGIALFPRNGEDADTLMRVADTTMYGAKRLGKNRYLLPQ